MADRPIPERVKLDDPDFERKVMRMLESLDSDVELSEIEEDDQYSESEHDTDSAISADEDGPASEGSVRSSESEGNDENELSMDVRYFYDKNRFKCLANPPNRNVRTPAHNIIKVPTSRSSATKLDPLTAFMSIFTEEMMDQIQEWTNKRIQSSRVVQV
ncbi:unnamed protein product [Acanthoscelides obtectus]|uniref:Uncharacterized protein n=1 Tax=Acanthoscelides obtectus TaxID=200917 RepID=A0A9P0K8C0_ACAOB|nr:unnamed protein product [Acanthoscelides obtectus]CAK1633451.1 hypothetical protein AOBTE_LOCUS8146 [Acanthoscelides obtectus]